MKTVACLSGSLMTAERSDSASSFLISLAAGSELGSGVQTTPQSGDYVA